MTVHPRDRLRNAMRKRIQARRSIVPETMLAISALMLGLLAIAAQNPRQADALLMQVAGALIEQPAGIDFETTASIPRKVRSLSPDDRAKPLPQDDGDILGSAADGVDIDVSELPLRGSL